MGLFNRKKAEDAATMTSEHAQVACPHTSMVPRWDNLDDMGHEDRISGYRCDSCHESLSAEQGHQLRESEAERLRSALS